MTTVRKLATADVVVTAIGAGCDTAGKGNITIHVPSPATTLAYMVNLFNRLA